VAQPPTSTPLFPQKKILVIFHRFAPGERKMVVLLIPCIFLVLLPRSKWGIFRKLGEDMGESHGLPFTSQNGDLK